MTAKTGQPVGEMVSLATVAHAAGVSVATVSRIVNGERGRASAETMARVEEAVARLGYRPNPVGRALKRRASRVVAMLAPNLDNPAMAAIAVSTEAALRAAGYVTILCDTHDRPDLQDDYLDAMRSQFVAGYVMVSAVASRGLQKTFQRGDPMVFVARRNPFGGGAFVGIDDRAAGVDAADYLLGRGIDRPAVLMAAQNASSTAERAAGFVARLDERGVPESAVRRASAEGLNHIEIGYAAAAMLAAGGGWPAGVFCVSDLIAYGAYRLAREQAIAVPEACALVGVDGNALNAWIAPWLTSIRIPYEQYGGHIVAQLRLLWAGGAVCDIHVRHGPLTATGSPSSEP
jgi:LacI family transcriptional regulator